MKITVYNCRLFDELDRFKKMEQETGVEIICCPEPPSLENIHLAEGAEAIDIITSKMTRELIEAFAKVGVKYMATRTIGYDHIDRAACEEFGIHVSNSPYGPNGVADYTVMLILMTIRKAKRILQRGDLQDYTLMGNLGREMKDLTIGVIGIGNIGKTVVRNLSGFGCKILAYDLYEKEEVKQLADYVDLDTLLAQSDVITFHTPLTEENYHMINKETIAKMKDGAVLINTARGALIDTEALLEGLESGKIGGAGLDVVEDEFGLYYYDHKNDVLANRNIGILRAMPNVTVTHHMAFYTDNCTETVVRDSILSCILFMEGKENPWQVY
jgi:D-lactate dehydrogenase